MKESIAVGQILCATWGYDQTNATFFRVLKVANGWATVQQIKTDNQWKPDLSMTGKAVPVDEPDGDCGEEPKPARRKIKTGTYGESLQMKSYMWASPWDGQPVRVSCYA